jgi:hypothetical protein
LLKLSVGITIYKAFNGGLVAENTKQFQVSLTLCDDKLVSSVGREYDNGQHDRDLIPEIGTGFSITIVCYAPLKRYPE